MPDFVPLIFLFFFLLFFFFAVLNVELLVIGFVNMSNLRSWNDPSVPHLFVFFNI